MRLHVIEIQLRYRSEADCKKSCALRPEFANDLAPTPRLLQHLVIAKR